MGDTLEGAAAAEQVRGWLTRNPIPFAVVEPAVGGPTAPVTVIERATGKSLSFPWAAVTEVSQAPLPATGTPYLRILLDDGRVFAISSLGFIFAPAFTSTGPLPDCPSSASFLDYRRLFGHLRHLAAEDDPAHVREALQVLMVLLAFLDGARAIGLEVAEEERGLEPILHRLEGVAIPETDR